MSVKVMTKSQAQAYNLYATAQRFLVQEDTNFANTFQVKYPIYPPKFFARSSTKFICTILY